MTFEGHKASRETWQNICMTLDTRTRKYFIDRTQKTITIKEKNNVLDFFQVKTFAH